MMSINFDQTSFARVWIVIGPYRQGEAHETEKYGSGWSGQEDFLSPKRWSSTRMESKSEGVVLLGNVFEVYPMAKP